MLKVTVNTSVADVRNEFSRLFPFLRLQFYTRTQKPYHSRPTKDIIDDQALLQSLDLGSDAEFEINENMAVSTVENLFREKFGIGAQVYRRYGNIWLEASVTDDWSLRRQNDHAREVTEARG